MGPAIRGERMIGREAWGERLKYLVRGLAGLLVAFVAAILIVPALIDWNGYRADITAKAAQILGRPVEIRGDIGVALLPVPKISMTRAHLGNAEGASDADMLSLDAFEVRLAWAPLLIGNLRVESVKLVRPVLNIEIFDTGESNLTLTPRGAEMAKAPKGATEIEGGAPSLPIAGLRVTPKTDGGFDISVENFVIENGTVVYRNAVRGLVERVADLNGRIAFASLKGPMDISMRATVHGLPVSIEASAGQIIQGRTVPFNLDATIAPGALKAQFSGSLNGVDEALRLRGRLTAEGKNLADLARAMGGRDVPVALGRPFGLQTNLTLAGDGAELSELALKLDDMQANGHLSAAFDDTTTIDAALNATRLDLDSLLRPPAPAKPEPRAKAPAPSSVPAAPSSSIDPPPADNRLSLERLSLETLPSNLTANLTIGIDAITWRGAAIRQSKLDLSLANREITVSQLSALLPGNSDVAAFGFVTEKDALPQFDGTVEMTSSDLRAALDWLGLSTKGIAGDRLRSASLNARLSVRPDVASATDLRARFDATQIDGALTVNIAAHPSFGANLTIDRVNLDAYMPSADENPAPAPKPDEHGPAAQEPKPSPAIANGSFAGLSALNGFNANLRARVGSVMFRSLPFNDVRIAATLADGTLDLKSASIGDLVGVTASASGVIDGLAAAEPTARDLVFETKGKSLANLFRMAEIKSPVSAEALGPVAAKVRFDGPLRTLDVASEIQAMGGRSSLSGRIDTREIVPRLDAHIELGYPDAARFVRGFGVDWRPRGLKGGIDLAANLSGTPFKMGLHDLAGSIAGIRVSGTAAARLPLLGRKTLVAMNLKTGDLDLDAFLPAKRTALAPAPSDRDARVRKAAFRDTSVAPVRGIVAPSARGIVAPSARGILVAAAARDGVWSSAPLDLSALSAFDGSFAVQSDSLRLGGVSIVNADLDAELQNGLLEIRHLTGKTFGGNLTVDGGLQAEAVGGRFEARYALADADMGAAERAFGGKEPSHGTATLEGRLRGEGKSAAELVSSLSGDGSLAFKGIDGADGQGSILALIGGIAQSLERLGGLRGRLEPVPINLSGPYRIENGVISFEDLAFSSPIGDGGLKGRADLPRWQLAAQGEIRLAKEFVIGGGPAKPVPFALNGALDAPRLKLDIAALPGGGIQIPLDKLKTKKGATELLKSFIPNRAPKRVAPTVEPLPPPGAKPAQPQVQPEVNAGTKAELKADPKSDTQPDAKTGERVEDILKDILRGVSR
jgi:hypothetical protein